MADNTKPSASTVQSDRYEQSPAKAPGDRDEAKALADDVVVNVTGGPEADLHHPAAADSVADSEAGANLSSGRLEPLQGKRPSARRKA